MRPNRRDNPQASVNRLTTSRPTVTSLKSTKAFLAVYRRGHWVHGPSLSLGVRPNAGRRVRAGLRTRRGLKGAVLRNRLKRQLRTILYARNIPLREGLDLVIVIHPRSSSVATDSLENELRFLCKRTGALL